MTDGVWSLWNRGEPIALETGRLTDKNIYGTHPFYMGKASDAKWFGVYTNLLQA